MSRRYEKRYPTDADPVWFPVTEENVIEHLANFYIDPGQMLTELEQGYTVSTPYAEYRVVAAVTGEETTEDGENIGGNQV